MRQRGLRVAGFIGGICLFTSASRAVDKVGDASQGGTLVPTEQLIRPAGDVVRFPGRPVDLVLSPDGKFAYVKNEKNIVVLNAAKLSIVQEIKFPTEGASMHGIVLSRDGKKLYTSGSGSTLWEQAIGTDGKLAVAKPISLPAATTQDSKAPAKRRASYPCGIALSPDGATAYVCLSMGNSLATVDLTSGKITGEIPVGIAPYGVVVSADGNSAFVTNWGGRRPVEGDRTALSAGTPVVVSEHGIGASGTVGVVDLAARRTVAEIPVGLHPADIAMNKAGDALYVANANSDTVSVIDVARRQVKQTLSVRPDAALAFGSAPNALTLSPDEKTLFVANGGNNAVAALELPSGTIKGFIPAGWYPGAVACRGDELFIANIKGIGSRDVLRVKEGWNSYYVTGTVNRVKLPGADELQNYTKQVLADARVPEALRAAEKAEAGVAAVPLPKHVGDPSKIDHVIYVVKENRTYDQVLGDMKQGNGSADLCIFGRKVTPNHHALAEQFVLLDNFYCNGILSADGHQWAMEGDAVDGLEKSFGGWSRSYPFAGDDALAFVSSGFLWTDALAHGLSFRNYGEMSTGRSEPPGGKFDDIYADHVKAAGKFKFATTVSIDELRRYSCPDYPGWNLAIPDAVRVDAFLRELKGFEAKGNLPSLTIVYLPSDHTRGTSPGVQTPQAMVADNDLAVGKVVEAISHSKFWPTSCVFIIEDDPQNGFDHVDGHRSLCLIASPYTKRGQTISAFYNQTSVLHTMELMLGLPAMNQLDAMAPVMRECFTDTPDGKPYTALPNEIPLDQLTPKLEALNGNARAWAEKSLAQPLDLPDKVDDDTFNRVIWFSAKGEQPFPTALSGAHGKGLTKLGLKLDARKHKDDDDDDD